jgi:hypothetical protein
MSGSGVVYYQSQITTKRDRAAGIPGTTEAGAEAGTEDWDS